MNLPRLIIADEFKPESVPSALLLLLSMKNAGMNIKIFTCARSEEDIRFIKILMGASVCILDTYTLVSPKNLKNVFQRFADNKSINVIIAPLGRCLDEKSFQIRPESLELAKTLGCCIVPTIFASASAIITSNIAMSAISAMETEEKNRVQGIIFSSVRNSREFQLLEQDFSRRSPILSLGFIPKDLERAMPSMVELNHNTTSMKFLQIKSASLQLANTDRQIEWKVLSALSSFNNAWVPPEPMAYPAKNITVAIVGDEISLEGEGPVEAFRLLGCQVQRYNPWTDPFPMGAEAIYFPHSMFGYCADQLLSNSGFCAGLRQSFAGGKLMFAAGASSLIFGKSITTPTGSKLDGLGIFSFSGTFSGSKDESEPCRVEIRGLRDTYFSLMDEKLRGHTVKGVRISNPGNVEPPTWSYRDIRRDAELGVSGWSKSYCFVTDLRIEPWSAISIFNRWLMQRKK